MKLKAIFPILIVLILIGAGIFLCTFSEAAGIIVYTLIGVVIVYLLLGISIFLLGS